MFRLKDFLCIISLKSRQPCEAGFIYHPHFSVEVTEFQGDKEKQSEQWCSYKLAERWLHLTFHVTVFTPIFPEQFIEHNHSNH